MLQNMEVARSIKEHIRLIVQRIYEQYQCITASTSLTYRSKTLALRSDRLTTLDYDASCSTLSDRNLLTTSYLRVALGGYPNSAEKVVEKYDKSLNPTS